MTGGDSGGSPGWPGCGLAEGQSRSVSTAYGRAGDEAYRAVAALLPGML